jgi:hypothetical protein
MFRYTYIACLVYTKLIKLFCGGLELTLRTNAVGLHAILVWRSAVRRFLGIGASDWSIVPVTGYWCLRLVHCTSPCCQMNLESWWYDNSQGKTEVHTEKHLPTITLFTNSTWLILRLNLGLRNTEAMAQPFSVSESQTVTAILFYKRTRVYVW